MVTDGVNVLSVRSRTTRSSKGKVCPVSSLFSFEHHFHPSLFCLCLTPSIHPPRVPSDLAHSFFSPLSVLTSSSPTQKQTHSNSRSNSVSSVSTRPTQPATEIAFSARFQTNYMAPRLVITSFARTYVIGFSRTVSVMPPSLTMNAAWTSTFLSCVNKVRPHLCSIISQAPTRLHTVFSATYGGHLELSAFAHMKKCNVKVIQPGLVYLIEWAAGWDAVAAAVVKETPTSSTSSLATTLVERDPIMNDRSRRAARRESRRAEKENARADKAAMYKDDDDDQDTETPTVYVA